MAGQIDSNACIGYIWRDAKLVGVAILATLNIRQIDDGLKQRLRVRAAQHGRSMEAEVRAILQAALDEKRPAQTGADFLASLRALFDPIGGVELDLPARDKLRPPPELP